MAAWPARVSHPLSMPRHRLSPDSVNPMRAAGKTCKSHRRGAYSGHGGEGYEGKAGGLGMPGGSWASAGPVGGSSPGRPGWAGPVRRIGDPGAVSISGGVGPADGTGRRGVPGSGSSGPAAGVPGPELGPFSWALRAAIPWGPAPWPSCIAGGISRREACRLLLFSNNCGPAFILGGGAGLLRQPSGRGCCCGGCIFWRRWS